MTSAYCRAMIKGKWRCTAMKRVFYSNDAWKEFCTLHGICRMMVETLYGKMQLTQKELVSVSDPVCGTGR